MSVEKWRQCEAIGRRVKFPPRAVLSCRSGGGVCGAVDLHSSRCRTLRPMGVEGGHLHRNRVASGEVRRHATVTAQAGNFAGMATVPAWCAIFRAYMSMDAEFPLAVQFRYARLDDLAALQALEAEFPGDRLSRRALLRAIHSPRARFRVALAGEVLLGNALVLLRRDSAAARLYSLIVAATGRGRGLGGQLLDDAAIQARRADCDELRLEVRADNVAAIRLYQRAGFVEFGRRPGYYADGAEAVRMRKRL